MTNHYKLYQLLLYFVSAHSYKNINIAGFNVKDEMWIVNEKHHIYPIIRITLDSIEQVVFQEERLKETIAAISKQFRIKEGRFLDIHIGHDEIYEEEIFDSIAIDSNYYDGIDVLDIFPGLKKAIYESNDNNLIRNIIFELNSINQIQRKQKSILKYKYPIVSYLVIAICILLFAFNNLFLPNFTNISKAIVLGADYKIFTLGLGQFWRLITVAFNHISFIHLFMNCYSLYIIGIYLEEELGHYKFAIALFISILLASITNGIMPGNTLSVGLSGGIYGLMAIFLLKGYFSGFLNQSSILQIVFINLAINFVPNVAFMAHLGGGVAGVLLYYAFYQKRHQKYMIILLIILTTVLGLKYLSQDDIRPYYAKTDAEVIKIYRTLGLNNYADNIRNKLYKIYERGN